MICNSKLGFFPKLKANRALIVGGCGIDIKGKVEQILGY